MALDDPVFIESNLSRMLLYAPEQVGFDRLAENIDSFLRTRDELACRELIITARAFVRLLNNPHFTERLRDFYNCIADTDRLTQLTRLFFTDYPATRVGMPISDAQNAQMLVSLPLGVQKARAREHCRQHHEALLHSPWPQVIEILVQNPSISERDILRMASRKPTQNDLLEPILASSWSSRAEVRFALAANPCFSVSHAIRCAVTLPNHQLAMLSGMPELHGVIRDFAFQILHYSNT